MGIWTIIIDGGEDHRPRKTCDNPIMERASICHKTCGKICGPFTHHQLASSGSLKLAAVWYVSDKVWTICRKNLIVTIPKVWRPVTLKSRNLWPVLGYSIPTGKHPPVSSTPQSDRFWRYGQRLGVTTEMINIPQLQVATGCFFHFTGIPTNKNEEPLNLIHRPWLELLVTFGVFEMSWQKKQSIFRNNMTISI